MVRRSHARTGARASDFGFCKRAGKVGASAGALEGCRSKIVFLEAKVSAAEFSPEDC